MGEDLAGEGSGFWGDGGVNSWVYSRFQQICLVTLSARVPVLSSTLFRRWQGPGRNAFSPGFSILGRASELGTGMACREGRARGRWCVLRLSSLVTSSPSGGDC